MQNRPVWFAIFLQTLNADVGIECFQITLFFSSDVLNAGIVRVQYEDPS